MMRRVLARVRPWPAACARGLHTAFLRKNGGLRVVWRLAIGYALYALWAFFIQRALAAAFGALFDAWGLTSANLAYAPAWARGFVEYYGSVISMVSSAGAIALSLVLMRAFKQRMPVYTAPSEKSTESIGGDACPRARFARFCVGLTIGVLLAVLSAGLFLLTDSLRLYAAKATLSGEPILFLPVMLLAALAEECFARSFVLSGFPVNRQSPKETVKACLASAAVLFLLGGGYALSPVGMLNLLMLGALLALLRLRFGLALSLGLRFGLSYAQTCLVAFPGQTAARAPLYSLYAMSENGLTGGSDGLISGLWLTFVMLVALAFLSWKAFKRHLKAR